MRDYGVHGQDTFGIGEVGVHALEPIKTETQYIADLINGKGIPGPPIGGFIVTYLSCLMYGLEMISRGGGETRITICILAIGLVMGLGYARHARWTLNPILDFKMLRIPTFGISVVGGAQTCISAGSMPFLLPVFRRNKASKEVLGPVNC
jgi:hypothetical protein